MINETSHKKFSKQLGWLSAPRPGHLVQFYRSSNDLLDQLLEFLSCGLENHDACIVIATPEHVRGLNDQLINSGFDVESLQRNGQYVVLDAAGTLARFMVGGMPDRDRFFAVVGSLIKQYGLTGRPIRAYGEMVALLWKYGNKQAVIKLENLWNELAESQSFSLFCAYPELHFVMDNDASQEIRECHNVELLNFANG